jgi:endo-1,4-beta-xylanase
VGEELRPTLSVRSKNLRMSRTAFTRRAVIGGLVASAFIGPTTHAQVVHAQPRRIPFGAAMMKENRADDPEYGPAILRHCDIIVPMNDLKWEALRPAAERYTFEDADSAVAYAKANGKALRGHTLCWYEALPKWMKDIRDPKLAENMLRSHIERVVDRYRGTIPSWDVVNEAIAHDPQKQGNWRDMYWNQVLGVRHLEVAFEAAMRADPTAELVYNDYDLENTGIREDERRQIVLSIVRRLQERKISIHSIGFQAHLYAERSIDSEGLYRFGRALRELGVGVKVTELDVIDWRLPPAIAERDESAARHVTTFLEALHSGNPIQSIVTWGITDRHSWVSDTFKRNDRLANRPLPLDANYREKPMMRAIERFRNRA